MQPILAFVPLDQRPVCVDRVIYAGQASGFDVHMPNMDDCALYLDGQVPKVPRGVNGNGDKIMDWLEEMQAAGCRHYIIHLDQMFSGGLAGSRFPDRTEITAKEQGIMARLAALANHPDHKVYFVDTVMRLASTGNYKGYGIDEYHAFRRYAQQPRLQLDENDFATRDEQEALRQIDRIVSHYTVGWQGESIAEATLTQTQLALYHRIRLRKLLLINQMMQRSGDRAVYFIGIDDASPQITIQTNEIAFIKRRMEALSRPFTLCCDTDCSGLLALARCVNDHYQARPTIRVRYFGNQADAAADSFDVGTLRQSVNDHIASVGAQQADENGDMELLVLTKGDGHVGPGQEDMGYTAQIHALVAKAQENIAHNIPTIIVDASNDQFFVDSWAHGFPNLQDELIDHVELARLLCYSHWNTVGNAMGIALGMGVARHTYLAHESNIASSSHTAFMKALAFAYIKDIGYNARNKPVIFPWSFAWWLSREAGGAGWNIYNFYPEMLAYAPGSDVKEEWEVCDGEHMINAQLEKCMLHNDAPEYNHCIDRILRNFSAGRIITALRGNVQTALVPHITLSGFRCTLYRHFEINFDITLHEKSG